MKGHPPSPAWSPAASEIEFASNKSRGQMEISPHSQKQRDQTIKGNTDSY